MPNEPPAPALAGTQRVGAFTDLPALVRALGADPLPALAAAGLGADAFSHPEARVPYRAFGAFLREAAQRTQCEHFGVLAGRIWRLADLGLVGELVTNSRTVGEALQTMTVYQHLNSGGGLGFMLRRGGWVDVGYAIYQPDVPATELINDAVIAGNRNFLHELCGPSWRPAEVLLSRPAPVDASPYRQFFGAPVRFGAEICALRFADHWLDEPIEGYDHVRRRDAEARARELGRGSIVNQVTRALRLVLLHGKHKCDDVADVLAMHRRTLNRQLRDEGTTFQELLDTVRFDVARQLLADSDLSIDDVADVLGYADVTPFTRRFQHWSGTSPAVWRRTRRADAAMDA